MRFYCGVDLGKLSDYSATTILERIEDGEFYRYECAHIERFPLGMSYPKIVDAVGALLERTPLAGECELSVDASGVGVAVSDMFSEAGMRHVAITITGGVGWHRESLWKWHVSKHLLVSTVQKFLSSEAIGISKHLHAAKLLKSELQDFRVKISKAQNEIYESREGQHDDLVLSLAVGLFAAEHAGARWLPIGQ
jgi:hypothetical protein